MASKARNRHALQHGVYARDTVLPWEDAAAFDALHQCIIAELNPNGPLEEEAVREIAELQWRKQRLAMGYLLPFYRDPPPPELIAAAKQGLMALASYLADTAQSSPGTITATASEMLDMIKRRAFGGSDGAKKLNMSQSLDAAPAYIVEQAYDPANFALRLKVEMSIDNRMAKTMSRLVGLKEYKRIYGEKPVRTEPPPLAAPPPELVGTTPEVAPIKRKWGDPE